MAITDPPNRRCQISQRREKCGLDLVQAAVSWRLGAIDVRNRHDDDLELHLDCVGNRAFAPKSATMLSPRRPGQKAMGRDSKVKLHLRCCRRQFELNIKQVDRHCGKDTSIQAPAVTHAMPAARAIHRPTGVSFSKRTSSAKSAIQSTFITPPTNKSAIKTQQQPTQ